MQTKGVVAFRVECIKETPDGVQRNYNPVDFSEDAWSEIEDRILQCFEGDLMDFELVQINTYKMVVSIAVEGDIDTFEKSTNIPNSITLSNSEGNECHLLIEDVKWMWYKK